MKGSILPKRGASPRDHGSRAVASGRTKSSFKALRIALTIAAGTALGSVCLAAGDPCQPPELQHALDLCRNAELNQLEAGEASYQLCIRTPGVMSRFHDCFGAMNAACIPLTMSGTMSTEACQAISTIIGNACGISQCMDIRTRNDEDAMRSCAACIYWETKSRNRCVPI